ncbi:CorA family divalent cation transporter [Elizabethkingia sp. JS20170427COW]|uniref:CorA family divalent cation transporter n=1 Tax=Elizabethkingia sp. JS20170427COW TaxID=2583851 RepID=UPI001110AC3A|nr:CorA family divalent cation transporter [Elizabethkingia sp. JS20170427COW]QCX54111.1 magnesium transporter CorA [Elizabethkingia sp. JS20170427COW]
MPIKVLFESENCTWIDVIAPSAKDLEELNVKFGINELLLQDTVESNHLPKYDEADGVKFFLARENVSTGRKNLNTISDVSTKLGIFISKKFLISVHRLPTSSIDNALLEVNKSYEIASSITPDRIALMIGLKILQTFDRENERILDIMDKLESNIFLGKGMKQDLIKSLYRIKRKAGLNLRILNISSDWVSNFNKLNLEHVEVMDLVDKQKDAIADYEHLGAQVTNLIGMFLALSDQRNNEAMKILSTFSIYFLPITFIAGLYGMNFNHMPELNYKYGYFICLGVMVLVVIITFIYLKRKKF